MRGEARRMYCGPIPADELVISGFGHLRRSSGIGFDFHEVIDTTHLTSGREVPFFTNTRSEWRLKRTFELVSNYTFGWSDRGDRFRHKILHRPPGNLPAAQKAFFREFDTEFSHWVRSKFVGSRDEAVERLREAGTEVSSDEDSITVFYEPTEIRFHGGKYRRDFDYSPYARDQEAAYADRSRQLPGLRDELKELRNERDRRVFERFRGRNFLWPSFEWGGGIPVVRAARDDSVEQVTDSIAKPKTASKPQSGAFLGLGVKDYLRDESGVASVGCDNARSNWDFEGMGGNWQRGESRRNASLGDKNQRSPSSAKSCGEQGEISSPDKRSRASDWDRETDGRNQGEPTTGVVQGARQGRTVDLPLLFRTGFAAGEIKNELPQPERQQNSNSCEAGLRSTFGVISRRLGSAFFGDTGGDSGVEAANYEPSATAIRAGDGRVFPVQSVVSELSPISGADDPDGLDRTLDFANAALLDASVERLGKAIETFEGEIGLQARPPLPIPRPALDYDLSR
jgi:hypothetical protein